MARHFRRFANCGGGWRQSGCIQLTQSVVSAARTRHPLRHLRLLIRKLLQLARVERSKLDGLALAEHHHCGCRRAGARVAGGSLEAGPAAVASAGGALIRAGRRVLARHQLRLPESRRRRRLSTRRACVRLRQTRAGLGGCQPLLLDVDVRREWRRRRWRRLRAAQVRLARQTGRLKDLASCRQFSLLLLLLTDAAS